MSDRTMHRDRGAVLPLVLAVSIFFALVIVALARLVTSDLSFARVAESRAERSSAALGAIDYGVERIRLGQTLCAGPSAGFGPVTDGLLDRNGTTTTLSCTRLATDGSEITGWAAVITGQGFASNRLEVQGGGTTTITGAIYIDDVADIALSVGSDVVQRDGDLWHRSGSCPGGPVTLPSEYTFSPSQVRGRMCTTATWNQLIPTPSVPDLNATSLPTNNGQTYTTIGTCRVFAPGRYTGPPSLSALPTPPDVYFQSGVYWFQNVGAVVPVADQVVWFGHPGTNTAETPNPDCVLASQLDANTGGTGAVVYLSGNSRFRARGQVEFFDRLVGGTRMSVHALESSSGYVPSTLSTSSGIPLVRVSSEAAAAAVFHGLVYAPNAWLEFVNSSDTAQQQLLGGAVTARLTIGASPSAPGFQISAAPTPTLVKIQLTATSAATDGSGATTTVSAIVDYRPDAITPDDRVAVNSIRIVD